MAIDLIVNLALTANNALNAIEAVKGKIRSIGDDQKSLNETAKGFETSVRGATVASGQLQQSQGGVVASAAKLASIYTKLKIAAAVTQSEQFKNIMGQIVNRTATLQSVFAALPQPVQQTARNAAETAKNLASSVKNGAEMGASFSRGLSTAMNLGKTLVRFAPHIAAAAIAMWAFKKAVDASFKRFEEIQRQAVFGVTEKNVQDVSKSLDGLVTRAEAANIALQFRQAGLSSNLIGQAADLASAISKITGATKEQAIEQVRSGQITEETLRAMGVSASELENAYQKAQGASQRPLEASEKLRVAVELLGKRAQALKGDLTAAFPVNPFKEFGTQFRAVGDDFRDFLARDLGPAIVALSKGAAFVLRGLVSALRAVVNGIREVGQWMGVFGKGQTDATKAADRLRGAMEKNEKAHKKNAEAATRNTIEVQRYRAAVQAASEAQRTALRDTAATLEGAAGGLSGVLAAGSEALGVIEKFAVAYNKFFAVAAKEEPNQIIRLRARKQITAAEERAYLAINAAINKAAAAQSTALRIAQEQLSAQRATLGVSEEQKQIAAAELAIFQSQQEALASASVQQRRIFLLAAQAYELEEKAAKTRSASQKRNFAAQAAFVNQQLVVAKAVRDLSAEQAKAQQDALKAQLAQAQIQRDFAAIRSRADFARKATDAETELLSLARSLAEVRGKLSEQAKVGAEGAQADLALQRRIEDALLRQREIRRTLEAPGLAAGDKRKQLLAESDLLKQQIDLLQDQKRVQSELTAARIQALTVFGQLQQQFAAQTQQFNANLATNLKGSIDGAVGAVGSAISTLFQGLVTGQKDLGSAIGSGILDALSGVAAQMGTFLLLAGTGLTASLIPTGPAAVAAGLGLLALAGTLKGIGANIAKTPQTPQVNTPERTSLPGQEMPRERQQQTTFVMISGFLGSEQEQYRKFQQFIRKNSRAVGG